MDVRRLVAVEAVEVEPIRSWNALDRRHSRRGYRAAGGSLASFPREPNRIASSLKNASFDLVTSRLVDNRVDAPHTTSQLVVANPCVEVVLWVSSSRAEKPRSWPCCGTPALPRSPMCASNFPTTSPTPP